MQNFFILRHATFWFITTAMKNVRLFRFPNFTPSNLTSNMGLYFYKILVIFMTISSVRILKSTVNPHFYKKGYLLKLGLN